MIVLRNVGKKVKQREILKDINLKLGKGLTFIIGDSGAGKSTLLNLMGNLDCGEGEISLLFAEATESIVDIPNYCRDYVGFIFQEYNLINGLTVYQNIKVAAELAGVTIEKDVIDATLEQFGILKVANDKVDTLSGGEKQRVSIVRALLKGSDILLADEPTGSLDQENTRKVFEELKQISKERCVIVVTHNTEMAQKYADRIIKMENGQIVADVGDENVGCVRGKEQNKKSKLYYDSIIALTLNSIFRFKSKFFATVISISIAIALIGTCFFMSRTVSQQVDEMNNVYYDADLVTVYSENPAEKEPLAIVLGGEGKAVPDEMIEELRNSNLFDGVVPCIEEFFYTKQEGLEIHVKQITMDSFFESRIMTDDVEGEFPTSENEIIIAESLADSLYGGDCIGMPITIVDDSQTEYEYIIVGINHASNVDGICYSYIPNESLYAKERDNVYALIYLTNNVEDLNKDFYTEDGSGFVCRNFEGNVLYGKFPDQNNEILISMECARYLYYSIMGEYYDFTANEIIQHGKDVIKNLNIVFEKTYYLATNSAYTCKVVGVHNGNSDAIYVSDSWSGVVTKSIPQYAECYIADVNNYGEFETSDINQKYYCVSNYEERFSTVVQNTGIWKMLFVLISIIAAAMGFVLINSFDKISFVERKRELGILKSLGATKRELREILLFEHLITGVAAGICALIIYIIITLILKISYDFILTTQENILVIIGMLLFPVVISLVASIKTINKTIGLKPIDALRSQF